MEHPLLRGLHPPSAHESINAHTGKARAAGAWCPDPRARISKGRTIMAAPNTKSIQSRDSTLIAGMKKRLSATVAIIAAGVTYTPVALAALFQSQIDALNMVASTRAQWRATVLAARALALTVNQVYSARQTILRSQY